VIAIQEVQSQFVEALLGYHEREMTLGLTFLKLTGKSLKNFKIL